MYRGGQANDLFAWQLQALKLPAPQREWVFGPPRKYRFDFAWPVRLIAVEINGGVWKPGGGAHSRPANILRDFQKLNLAATLGWRVWQYTTDEVRIGFAAQQVAKLFQSLPPLPEPVREENATEAVRSLDSLVDNGTGPLHSAAEPVAECAVAAHITARNA